MGNWIKISGWYHEKGEFGFVFNSKNFLLNLSKFLEFRLRKKS